MNLRTGILLILVFIATGCISKEGAPVHLISPSANSEDVPVEVAAGVASGDLGSFRQGTVVNRSVVLRNPSPNTVTFSAPPEVSLPCCMQVKVSPEKVEPNGIFRVELSFDTRLRPGSFELYAKLFPSEPDCPSLVYLKGQVESEFRVEPSFLEFREPGEKTVIIDGSGLDKTFRLKRAESNTEALDFELSPNPGAGERTLRIRWNGRTPTEAIRTPAVYLITDNERLGWWPVVVQLPSQAITRSNSH